MNSNLNFHTNANRKRLISSSTTCYYLFLFLLITIIKIADKDMANITFLISPTLNLPAMSLNASRIKMTCIQLHAKPICHLKSNFKTTNDQTNCVSISTNSLPAVEICWNHEKNADE